MEVWVLGKKDLDLFDPDVLPNFFRMVYRHVFTQIINYVIFELNWINGKLNRIEGESMRSMSRQKLYYFGERCATHTGFIERRLDVKKQKIKRDD